MNELLVNILPISENPLFREEMMNQFLSTVHFMASSKHWNHKKMRFTLTWENNCFIFQGGRYHLPPHCIKFVSVPLDIYSQNVNHTDWLKEYNQFIILADAKEVAENHTVRLEIAKYRSLMHRQKLHSEEVLLLLDVQKILTIPDGYSYENTVVGILSALAGKPRKGFALLPTYTSNWNQIINLHLGQSQRFFKTKNGNVIGLPINLMGTFDAFPHSGVMELLWKFMTILLLEQNIEIKRISNHFIYNTVMEIFRNFADSIDTKLNNKTIKLAIIGETSSGKSYLLTDLLTSLNNLGFNGINDMKHNCRYAGNYITDVTNRNRAISQTIQSVARIDSHYRGIYSNGEKQFNLEFIDIPGEVITRDKIVVFSSIIEALWRNKKKIFNVETWEKEERVYKVLYYSSNNRTVTNVSNHSYSGGLEDDEDSSKNTTPQATSSNQAIMTTDEVRTYLANAGYTKAERISSMSGKDVIKDFYNFHPDTVINAIMEAWNILEPEQLKNFQNEDYDSVNDYKELFRNNFQLDFYYLFFCMNATDIVICNKMAIPASVGLSPNGLNSFNDMIEALKCLKAKEKIFSKKNWYLALKGSDSYMDNDFFRDVFEITKRNHNVTYSFFTALVIYKLLQSNTQARANRFRRNNAETTNTPIMNLFIQDNIDRFKGLISIEGLDDDILQAMQEEANNNDNQIFKSTTEYTITSGLDLREHINQCIDLFNTLTQFGSQEGDLYQILQIPPHVYFPATPITNDFTICGHKPKEANIFEGNAATAGNRICFGTFQLCLDILKQHKIEPDTENACYGGLLSYFMGD